MEKYYYVDSQGNQCGPFEKEFLKNIGITPTTFVYTQGLSEWTPASQVPSLSDILAQKSRSKPVPPSSYMWLGILSIIFCWPVGIVSVYYASKVSTLWLNECYKEAKKASQKALIWGIIPTSIWVILIIFLMISNI